MKPSKATVSIMSLIASGSLGVDAMVFDDTVLIPKEDVIANERVEVKQIDNIVEAKAPWKGEQGITVKYDMGEPTFTDRVKDRRKQEVIYETVNFGDGGFKVDVLLTEKPDTNRFCYIIEGAENYDFFYQPPLTPEEIAEGASRPPEIEGSYAVYHKTLKNHVIGQENYATGKVMHIPRPQVWEIGNEEVSKQWADLSYENGQLCVTAPQDFLDKADYTNGVRIDPTFGYTSIGGSFISRTSASSNRAHATTTNLYTASTDGNISQLSIYSACTVSGSGSIGMAVYTFSGGVPVTRIIPEQTIVINSTTPQLFTNNVSGPLIGGVKYTVGYGNWQQGTCTALNVYYDSSPVNDTSLSAAGALASTWSQTSVDSSVFSAYATYSIIPPSASLNINNGTLRINNGTIDL